MAIETAARTDPGRVRDHNEDSVRVVSTATGQLLVVADGMGGHDAGDVASATAVETFVDELDADAPAADALVRAARAADEAVREAATAQSGREGMGTTLVAALLDGDEATVVNVGDSRAYYVDGSSIEQVTVDHSVVQQLLDAGEITEAEAEGHPRRHVLSQALGAGDGIDPDTFSRPLDGGTLLLCSDGLTEEVPESTVHELVAGADSLEAAADRLVAAANDSGGSDNVSVVLGRHR